MSPSELAEEDLRAVAPGLSREDLAAVLRPGATLESKVSHGGTALARVREQLEQARAALGPA